MTCVRMAQMACLTVCLLALPCAAQCIVQEITAPPDDPKPSNFNAVASAGDVLAVGNYGDFFEDIPGRVHMYRRIDSRWRYETTLLDPDAGDDTAFYGPATNGEVLLVSAPTADGGSDFTGAVHVYRYDETTRTWTYETRLFATDGDQSDSFGFSVAIEGDVAVIAARNDEYGEFTLAGSVYVFRYDRANQKWREEQKLYAFTPATFELFGKSVDIHGDRIIVGANGVDEGRGAAYVFRYGGQKWTGEAELTAYDGQPGDRLGWSVNIGPACAAVGAPESDQPLGAGMGAAYTFIYQQGRWVDEPKIIPLDPVLPSEFFGSIVVATPVQESLLIASLDSFGAFFAGAAFVYRRIDDIWTQTGKLGDPAPEWGGGFSGGLAINSNQAIIGRLHGDVVYVVDGIHQRDCDGDGTIDACAGAPGPSSLATPPASCEEMVDLDGDGFVGSADIALLIAAWGTCDTSCSADVDADGDIDGFDLAYLLSFWGAVGSE